VGRRSGTSCETITGFGRGGGVVGREEEEGRGDEDARFCAYLVSSEREMEILSGDMHSRNVFG
jgi:hypothetical protein